MFIDYDYYQSHGGTLDSTAFDKLNRKAQIKLNYYTQNRITTPTEDVKMLMVDMIEKLNTMQGEKITSFSNDGVSVSYADVDEDNDLYQMVLEALPVSLISAVVK